MAVCGWAQASMGSSSAPLLVAPGQPSFLLAALLALQIVSIRVPFVACRFRDRLASKLCRSVPGVGL